MKAGARFREIEKKHFSSYEMSAFFNLLDLFSGSGGIEQKGEQDANKRR